MYIRCIIFLLSLMSKISIIYINVAKSIFSVSRIKAPCFWMWVLQRAEVICFPDTNWCEKLVPSFWWIPIRIEYLFEEIFEKLWKSLPNALIIFLYLCLKQHLLSWWVNKEFVSFWWFDGPFNMQTTAAFIMINEPVAEAERYFR